MWCCDNCNKEVSEPEIELIRDMTEFQGRDVPTGFYDEIDVCPDCGEPVRSTELAVILPDDALDRIPF